MNRKTQRKDLRTDRLPSWVSRRGDGSVCLRLHVQPNARKPGPAGEYGARLKFRLKSPPSDGKANRELCEALAEAAGVSKSQVSILRGATSRDKDVVVQGFTADDPAAVHKLAVRIGG